MSSAVATLKAIFNSQLSLRLILNDEEAKHVMTAWTLRKPTFTDATFKIGHDAHAQLDDLWERVGEIDFDALARSAGVPVTRTEKIFDRLKASRLIWPDGTIPDDARKIIFADVLAYAGQRQKTAAPLSKEKENSDGGKRTRQENSKTARQRRSAPARVKARRAPRR